MKASTFGKLVLSGVSLGSITVMSFFIYNDNKRLKEEYIQNEEKSDIIISRPPIRTTYVSPHRRSYGSSYTPPKNMNETIMPASKENINVQNCLIISNLEDNVLMDIKCELVSCIRKTVPLVDKYDKYLDYFE
tara:strand:+ start:112 stop:510 length:399 start_codon:yes stop_codon:yes gene_type:complete